MTAKLVPLGPVSGRTEELGDRALVSACATRDRAALAALYDRYKADVHRFVVRCRGVDDEVVDDLVQDTFLAAYKGAAAFRDEASVRTWLLGIAGNMARRHVRSDIRRRARAAVFGARDASTPSRPDEQAEQRELLSRMEEALDHLTQDQRVAFLLCDVEGVRGVDAARALNVREGTLYRRLHEARKALRAAVLGDGS